MFRKLAILSLLAMSALYGRVVVRLAPPIPVLETPVPTPGAGYVWTPGYYAWNGQAYVWVPGTWVIAPWPGARWIPPHWARHRGGWVFVEGHWR